jgi:hypothetical protein
MRVREAEPMTCAWRTLRHAALDVACAVRTSRSG